MQKRWEIKRSDLKTQRELSASVNISPITSHLLINRGLKFRQEAYEFLRCDLGGIADPFLFKDMEAAIARIKQAISKNESIMVYADYDVDGITGCAIIIKALKELGAQPIYYIPDRLQEGYGLNRMGIERAHQKKVSLLISVDCGINDHDEIDYARSLGIDVIVIDHHPPLAKLPGALAVIDPKRDDSTYPYKDLAGVGLAFRLAQALTGDDRWEDLGLVALGTVADIVPMTGENRILTKHGLMQLERTKSVGLKALMDKAGLAGKSITTRDIGYILAPRINAAGRLGNASDALRLLLTTSEDEADSLAELLDRANSERQGIQDQILKEVLAKVEREVNFKIHKAIVLWDENWHSGVIGIVASRVVEMYYRPTIIISIREGKGKGSGRSIENFHLFDALRSCEQFLEEYGGHKHAVGFTIDTGNVVNFRQQINSVASEAIGPEDLVPKVDIDMEIPLSNLSQELIEEIELLGPFGPCNPQPIFLSRDLSLRSAPTPIGRDSLSMWVTDQGITCEAVLYNSRGLLPSGLEQEKLHLAYSPSIYHWQGESLIRLNVKDIKVG